MSFYETCENKRKEKNDQIIEQFTEQQNKYEDIIKTQSSLSSQGYDTIKRLNKEIEKLEISNKLFIVSIDGRDDKIIKLTKENEQLNIRIKHYEHNENKINNESNELSLTDNYLKSEIARYIKINHALVNENFSMKSTIRDLLKSYS